jgi:hypothetical protein
MPDGRDLEHAFRFLDRPDPVAPAAREACERAASADADSALAEVDRLLAAHRDWGGLIAAGFAARWPKVD